MTKHNFFMASKIKFLLSILFCISFFNPSGAQTIDYNRIILPDNAQNISESERLVQLAWKNNPQNRIVGNDIKIARQQIKIIKSSWLEDIRLTGNFNEFVMEDLNPENEARVVGGDFYPLYNIGISIPLATFFRTPQKVKKAQYALDNQLERENSQKLRIRAVVLRSYENYKMTKEALRIQTQITENALNTFSLVEDRFKNGEATLDEYNNAFNYFKDEQLRKVEVQKEFNIAKLDLEELIGVDLDMIIID